MEGLKPLLINKYMELFQLCKNNGITITLTSGYRSPEEQDKLYAQGRTTSGNIVTQAKGGQSLHNFGVAFDICPLQNGSQWWSAPTSLWNQIGTLGESIGLEHGDRGYVDLPHFQMMMGYSLADFQNNKVDWTKWGVVNNTAPTPTVPTVNPINKLIDDAIAYLNSKRV